MRQVVITFSLAGCLTILGWGVIRAEPSFDQTAGYILNIVRAFRTAYVLHVVEHARDAGLSPREDWKTDAHFLPLPAQFVKEAAEQIVRRERVIIEAARQPGFNVEKLRAARGRAAEIH